MATGRRQGGDNQGFMKSILPLQLLVAPRHDDPAPLVLYHGRNCPDGFAAALAAWARTLTRFIHRQRRLPWPLLDPRECGQKVVDEAAQGAEIALVFGREDSGLTNEELQRCHYHVHIPSDPEFSSLNLGAAVQVLSYEIRMSWLAAQGQPSKVEKDEVASTKSGELATMDELERFYEHLEQTLVAIEFLDPEKPRHLMARLRRLYGRSSVSRAEMNILRGILTETQKAARGELLKRKD